MSMGYGLHQTPERRKMRCSNGKEITQELLRAPPFLFHLDLILTWLWDLFSADHFCLYTTLG